jgi:hypothetical protein
MSAISLKRNIALPTGSRYHHAGFLCHELVSGTLSGAGIEGTIRISFHGKFCGLDATRSGGFQELDVQFAAR